MSDSFSAQEQARVDSAQLPAQTAAVSPLVATPVADVVDGANALAAYHAFAEASVYAGSLKSMQTRRDFRDELIGRAQVLLAFSGDSNAVGSIDAEIQAAHAQLASSSLASGSSVNAFQRARTLEPHGFALLNMQEPYDIPTLKSAYRAAAKVHHPDVGGDTAIMQRINSVYGLFFAALQQDAASVQADPTQPSPTVEPGAAAVMNEARRAIFLADVDDLAADSAFALLPTLPLPSASALDGSIFQAVIRVAEMLSAMGRSEDAQSALAVGEKEFARLTARGLNFSGDFASAARVVANPKTLRLVINHQRQADNALRLGLITQTRYDQTIKRLKSNAAASAAEQTRLITALGAIQFARLPLDPDGALTPASGLVPNPGYYSRFDDLEPPQIEEYQRGFFGHDDALILKYIFIRLNALLKAAVQGFDLAAAMNEAQAIRDAASDKSSLQYYAGELGSLFAFFAQQSEEDRKERFAILMRIDKAGTGISMPIGPTQGSVRVSMPMPMTVSPAFLQCAREPLTQLRDA